MERKTNKSEREERAWMKHQIDLDVSEKAYADADDAIRHTLPDIVRALYALIPRLGHSTIVIQNNMFAQYYTCLHGYCQQYGYHIPSPEWKQVQSEYDDVFGRAKKHTEAISILQKGKAVTQPFYSRPDSLQTRTVAHGTNGHARRSDEAQGRLPPPIPTHQQQQEQRHLAPPPDSGSKPTRISSNPSYPPRPSSPVSTTSSFHTARDTFNAASTGGASRAASQISSPALSRAITSPQIRTTVSLTSNASAGSLSSAAAAAAIASKKKPPPPPPKRKPSNIGAIYVVAQYDFDGQGEGDLRFAEGDRIRVVKRTESENDWWEGECRGRVGSFPANYCKAA
jgi:amphiphysin